MEQLHLTFEGMPDEEPLPYSLKEMDRAFQLLDEYEYLTQRYPEMEQAFVDAGLEEAAQYGRVGSRWLGEKVKRDKNLAFTNNFFPLCARRAIENEPLLGEYIVTQPRAIDAAIAIRAKQKNPDK